MATKTSKKSSSKQVLRASELSYYDSKISCVCGATYEAGSTMEEIRVDICAGCHPFFTGEKRFIDSEGRVEKFMKKYNLSDKSGAKETKETKETKKQDK